MENPGLITISTKNIKSYKLNSFFDLWRTKIILHELCHMYIGNLVVLKDWSSMWIKEGMVEYLSHKCFK